MGRHHRRRRLALDNVLPAFGATKDHWRLDAGQRQRRPSTPARAAKRTGSTGEWRVDKQRLRWDILDAFAQAATEAGIPATDDFNRGTNEGVGYFG